MRYVYVILFTIVLAAPFVLRKALIPKLPGEDASGPGAERLVIITPHTADIRNEFARAFRAWHRDHYKTEVEIDYRIPGGTNDVKRQLETTYGAYLNDKGQLAENFPADISMVWGGGDFFMDHDLAGELHVLEPIQMPPELASQFTAAFPEPRLAGVKLYETTQTDGKPTPQWIGICLSSFGICYNADVYRALGLPAPSAEAGWNALTDPRLAGFVALADPAHSGSAAVAYQMVIQHEMAVAEGELFRKRPDLKAMTRDARAKNADYNAAIAAGWKKGMSDLLKIAANARYFTDSASLVPMDVAFGEAAAGMAIDFYARVTEDAVGRDRIQFITPEGATAITPDPIAILRGTKGRKLELSLHFIEFLLTSDAQRLWNLKPHTPGGPFGKSLRRMPIRQDVYRDRAGWADENIDPFTQVRGFNQRGEWMKLFNDSRPIWVAAWIDSRDELKDAYGRILAVTDQARQRALIDQLANLPISMSDVEASQKDGAAVKNAHGEVDEWKALQQIKWAGRFRAHYRTVGNDAR